jgi:hypothetical protein
LLRRGALCALVIVGLSGGTSRLWAQDAEPAETVEEIPPAPEPPTSPPPGEEVMRPTQHGIRLTPRMTEAFARQFAKEELVEKLSLDDEQQAKMTDIVARRSRDLNASMGREGAEAIERFYEGIFRTEVAGKKTLTPDEAREFSKAVRPGVRIIDEFWNGLQEDARPILSDEQFEKFKEQADTVRGMTRKFDERMDRWSRGEVKENETIVSGLQEDEAEVEAKGKSNEYAQAERSVRWRIDMMGPREWRQFLSRTSSVCGFDDSQKKAGEKLFAEYRDKAKAIMTKEWKAKALRNRVQQQLPNTSPDEPLEPWVYHLNMEYKELVKPIQEMGREFHRRVLALATPEQRQKLVDSLLNIATEHGMKPAEFANDVVLQGIVNTEPQTTTAPGQ